MEIILAIVVVSAVIFFGALISLGHERQRKAIDGLREQVVFWALQDLRLKREQLRRDVQVENPLNWLASLVSRVCGGKVDLEVLEVVGELPALICLDRNRGDKYLFSPCPPEKIRRTNRTSHGSSSRLSVPAVALALPKHIKSHEITALQGGPWFEEECRQVWKALTEHEIEQADSLWLYVDLGGV